MKKDHKTSINIDNAYSKNPVKQALSGKNNKVQQAETPAHNPKVVGSNPASANLENPVRSRLTGFSNFFKPVLFKKNCGPFADTYVNIVR